MSSSQGTIWTNRMKTIHFYFSKAFKLIFLESQESINIPFYTTFSKSWTDPSFEMWLRLHQSHKPHRLYIMEISVISISWLIICVIYISNNVMYQENSQYFKESLIVIYGLIIVS